MSECGLDECDLYGGCMFDCPMGRVRNDAEFALSQIALIKDGNLALSTNLTDAENL